MQQSKRLSELEDKIKESFAKKSLNCPVYYYQETDSTMEAAKELIPKEKSEVFIVLSDIQKSGRGRQSREWQSLAGNFFATIAFNIKTDIQKMAGFSLVAGLAACKALGNLGCRTRLKWPNDILSLSGKKLAGILIEIIEENGVPYVLCGIGINLVEVPKDLNNCTSIKELSGVSYTPLQAIIKVYPELKTYFDKFILQGFSSFKNEWTLNAAFIGRDITVHISKDKKISGMMMGVNKDGALQIEKNGKIETFTSGDIQI